MNEKFSSYTHSQEMSSNYKFKHKKFAKPDELETNCIVTEVTDSLNYSSKSEKYARYTNSNKKIL